MNKYILRIPYSFMRYGSYSCTVYANSFEEAEEMADDFGSHSSEDYDENSENDGNMDFEFSDVETEIEEEDVDPPFEVDADSKTTEKIPDYFLKEINLI
jgi:hypothetical protein